MMPKCMWAGVWLYGAAADVQILFTFTPVLPVQSTHPKIP